MRVRSVDSNNDWNYGKGRNDYKKDREAVKQCIKTELQCFLNDCYFEKTKGIDWFNLLGEKDILALQLAITATILNEYGVRTIIEISYDLDNNRTMNLNYRINSIFGPFEGSAGITPDGIVI